MNKIYYTVEKELQDVGDGIEETTGNKTVYLYHIVDGELVNLTDIELSNEDDTEEEIKLWLEQEKIENQQLIIL
jgi:hypothetical protein